MDFHTQFLILTLATVVGGAAVAYIPRAIKAVFKSIKL